jgi:hypothetical protein
VPSGGYSFRWLSPVDEPGLAVLAGTQPRHRAQLDWQRRPPGDTPSVCPRLRVVGDSREPPAQLDSSRQLSVLVKDSADRGSIGLGDNEHPGSMAARTAAGKARFTLPSCGWVRQSEGQTDLRALLRLVSIKSVIKSRLLHRAAAFSDRSMGRECRFVRQCSLLQR